jgi:hypothetical protein
MTRRLTVRIRPDGSIEAETHGMKGPECLSYIETLERLTEAETVDSWYTSEFFETTEGRQAVLEKDANREEIDGRG